MKEGRLHLLIVGNGMATDRLLSQLQQLAPQRFRISVVGQERPAAYNRILLTPWLNGDIGTDDLRLKSAEWYTRHNIHLHLGDAAVSIDSTAKTVRCQSGAEFSWDLLVIATGSQAVMPSIPGHDLQGVMCLRTQRDAEFIKRRCEMTRHTTPAGSDNIAVIGGGILGLEAACALHAMGLDVTLVHREGWLMNRQLDQEAGEQLTALIKARGIKVLTAVDCQQFIADRQHTEKLAAIELLTNTHGQAEARVETVNCDTAVLAIGIKPEIALASAAGIDCERAIVVDTWMRSSVPGIFAIGECCQINQELFGLVAPVYQQADVLAALLAAGTWQAAQPCTPAYQRQTLATRLKVAGVDVYSVGALPHQQTRSLTWRDRAQGHYRRLWIQDDLVTAACALGDIDGLDTYAALIDKRRPVYDPATLLLGSEMAV